MGYDTMFHVDARFFFFFSFPFLFVESVIRDICSVLFCSVLFCPRNLDMALVVL
jgi:hypothetical protein